MKDFVVIVPFYKRHELTNLCFENLQRQQKELKFFDIIVCGSEGNVSKQLAEKYGFKYVEYANNPVSEKNNYLIQQTKDYKAVIMLGSDDFLSDETLLSCTDLNLNTYDVYGLEYCHFYDVASNTLSIFQSRGQTVGAGRVYTQKLLRKIDYNLWSRAQNRGLDYLALQKVFSYGKEVIIKGDVLDVKHELNITNHQIIEMCEKIDIIELDKFKVSKILNLKESSTKQIYMRVDKKKSRKVNVEYLKDVYDWKIGDKTTIDRQLARLGVMSGDWKILADSNVKSDIPDENWSKEDLQKYFDDNSIPYKKTMGVKTLLSLLS